MPSIEVLSLAVNHISTLKDIQNCFKIQELYLRNNKISNFKELEYLKNLKKLKILSLSENPISDHSQYRKKVISYVPWLEKLDLQDVTSKEKETSSSQ
jgi:Leucine-rich repeat (LRR) protein